MESCLSLGLGNLESGGFWTFEKRKRFLDVIEANFEGEIDEINWTLLKDRGKRTMHIKLQKAILRQRWI